ncbi:MAG: hypothetical protein COT71_02025 [Candidatus Andersenbacteria bacterium CG10_big_fil_rev_8_21_14_0_10_54_11]|uniref:AAA+ ATPase domain-containing protein n=1 Tax=Candidatus Andersenbacteria bacterium CG10_big_fil_rev_8_21_14_0_10_54_11 TaxID=1974485 RepID=A0A2M6WZI6_9BACT|nr:MAG: hypothetical protein COT71_02025 [Candidatus Andersenbacteria bacterium CG10_big_fil_rev_8_21_14_0_10_54_11]
MSTYIARSLEGQVEEYLHTPKVLFLLGARQVGKTTLLERLLQNMRGEMINMDDDVERKRLLAAANQSPAEAVRSLGGSEVLVIDEAQRVPDIGRICKSWYDAHVPTKIILLGSSSSTLLDLAAGELVGRNEKLYLTPLLFEEIVRQQRWYSPQQPAAALQKNFADQVNAQLLQRLVFGSYPEACLTSEPREYLSNLAGDYILKDLFLSSAVRSPQDVRRLLLELAGAIGETVSVVQLATRLNLSRATVQRYLDVLESIFVVFRLPSYFTNPAAEITKQNKYYFWDTGVKNALHREWAVSVSRPDIAKLWENWVLAEIMKQSRTYRRQEDIYFWRSRNDSTVDLVVKQGSDLHAFDIRFRSHGWRPSLAFQRAYGVQSRLIHPGNILEVLM